MTHGTIVESDLFERQGQMKARVLYSVEPVSKRGSEVLSGELIHVEADSPGQAAERVLGERLGASGAEDRLRCRVWWLDEKFRTQSIPLYTLQ